MAEARFQEQSSVRSSNIGRDASPDSPTFTPESNFSLFSSASTSVERCSFASDAHDHDSLASQLYLHLAGHERDQNESCSGPDPDTNKAIIVHNHNRLSRKRDKVKVQKEESDAAHEKDENQLIDSARNSFSLALKDCKDRRTRPEALLKLPERLVSTSLDLNNVSASRARIMKKSSVATRKSGAFPCPATPNYHHHSSVGMQKGWNSERMSLHNNGIKRQGSAAGVLCSNNGKTLPSKWEDAERWILSPGSGDNGLRQFIVPHQRRPKSKSGPLGPPGTAAYNSLCSPSMYIFDGSNTGNFLVGSPFSAGVISTNGLKIHSRSHYGDFTVRTEPCMARSVSVHGCSEVVSPPSLPSRDENLHAVKVATTDTSPTVSRRDMATQMSPQGGTRSSPKGSSFFLSTPSALPIMELQGTHSSKSEVRDVQIDERVTMTRWSKKHGAGNTGKSSEFVDDWSKRAADTRTPTRDVTETAKCISKIKREEAKITAWENLQKAKAEAAIRKLEMKLEKKRSSSMNKIMNKLRSAQKRAREMRSSVLSNQALEVTRLSHETTSFCRTRQMGSLSGCFTCHAF